MLTTVTFLSIFHKLKVLKCVRSNLPHQNLRKAEQCKCHNDQTKTLILIRLLWVCVCVKNLNGVYINAFDDSKFKNGFVFTLIAVLAQLFRNAQKGATLS